MLLKALSSFLMMGAYQLALQSKGATLCAVGPGVMGERCSHAQHCTAVPFGRQEHPSPCVRPHLAAICD